jgi:hypothetical protein
MSGKKRKILVRLEEKNLKIEFIEDMIKNEIFNVRL